MTSMLKDKTASIMETVSQQSTEFVNKVKSLKESENDNSQIDEEKIIIDAASESEIESKIEQKSEETKKVFEETESKINHFL